VVLCRLPLGGADRERALAHFLRHAAHRFARGDNDYRQDQQRQRDAGSEDRLPEHVGRAVAEVFWQKAEPAVRVAEKLHKNTDRHQAEQNRRHAGQIVHGDFDGARDRVLRRIFLEVDAGQQADRNGDQRGGDNHQQRSNPR